MKSKLLACPYIVWMILFTIIPLGIVFYYALTDSVTGQFTLANLAGMGNYLPIFLRSIWLAMFSALICLVIGFLSRSASPPRSVFLKCSLCCPCA